MKLLVLSKSNWDLSSVTKKLLKFEKWVYFERFKSPKTLLNQGYKI